MWRSGPLMPCQRNVKWLAHQSSKLIPYWCILFSHCSTSCFNKSSECKSYTANCEGVEFVLLAAQTLHGIFFFLNDNKRSSEKRQWSLNKCFKSWKIHVNSRNQDRLRNIKPDYNITLFFTGLVCTWLGAAYAMRRWSAVSCNMWSDYYSRRWNISFYHPNDVFLSFWRIIDMRSSLRFMKYFWEFCFIKGESPCL